MNGRHEDYDPTDYGLSPFLESPKAPEALQTTEIPITPGNAVPHTRHGGKGRRLPRPKEFVGARGDMLSSSDISTGKEGVLLVRSVLKGAISVDLPSFRIDPNDDAASVENGAGDLISAEQGVNSPVFPPRDEFPVH